MTDEILSFAVPSDLAERFRATVPDGQRSAVLRELLDGYVNGGTTARAALSVRVAEFERDLEDLEAQRARLRERAATKREKRDRLQEQVDDMATRQERVILEWLEHDHPQRYDPENPAVKNYADKASLDPEAFVARVREMEAES